MMADEKNRSAGAHRVGGEPDQPHGSEGPPADRNDDGPRQHKPGTAREAKHPTKPTHPVEGAETRSGKPGARPGGR